MDRSVFGPPQWRTAAVMYRRTADVIPIVALKNPFAERDRIRRRRFRYTARYDSHLFGCLRREREGRGGVAGRMDFLERSRRNARNESNQDGGDDGNAARCPLSLSASLSFFTYSLTL